MGGASGHSAKLKKVDTQTKEQKKLHKKIIKEIDTKTFDLNKNPMFKQGQAFLTEMLDPSSAAFARYEAPYLRDFRENIVPGLADRFSQYGAQDSSAFKQSLGQGGERLSENLAALRTQGMMNASGQALNYAQAPAQMQQGLVNTALSAEPYGYQVIPPKQSATSGIASGIASGLSRGAATLGAYALGNIAAPGVGGPAAATALNSAWR